MEVVQCVCVRVCVCVCVCVCVYVCVCECVLTYASINFAHHLFSSCSPLIPPPLVNSYIFPFIYFSIHLFIYNYKGIPRPIEDYENEVQAILSVPSVAAVTPAYEHESTSTIQVRTCVCMCMCACLCVCVYRHTLACLCLLIANAKLNLTSFATLSNFPPTTLQIVPLSYLLSTLVLIILFFTSNCVGCQ